MSNQLKQQKEVARQALASILHHALEAQKILEENMDASFLSDFESEFSEHLNYISLANDVLINSESNIDAIKNLNE